MRPRSQVDWQSVQVESLQGEVECLMFEVQWLQDPLEWLALQVQRQQGEVQSLVWRLQTQQDRLEWLTLQVQRQQDGLEWLTLQVDGLKEQLERLTLPTLRHQAPVEWLTLQGERREDQVECLTSQVLSHEDPFESEASRLQSVGVSVSGLASQVQWLRGLVQSVVRQEWCERDAPVGLGLGIGSVNFDSPGLFECQHSVPTPATRQSRRANQGKERR